MKEWPVNRAGLDTVQLKILEAVDRGLLDEKHVGFIQVVHQHSCRQDPCNCDPALWLGSKRIEDGQ